MDVIVKEYANFAEMMVVVLGAYFFLASPLHASLFVAVAMVSLSLYLYNVPGAAAPAAATEKPNVAYAKVPNIEMDVMDSANDGVKDDQA